MLLYQKPQFLPVLSIAIPIEVLWICLVWNNRIRRDEVVNIRRIKSRIIVIDAQTGIALSCIQFVSVHAA
jgi:hypothetical protein